MAIQKHNKLAYNLHIIASQHPTGLVTIHVLHRTSQMPQKSKKMVFFSQNQLKPRKIFRLRRAKTTRYARRGNLTTLSLTITPVGPEGGVATPGQRNAT